MKRTQTSTDPQARDAGGSSMLDDDDDDAEPDSELHS